MLTHGRTLNAPVTPHDVIRATDIYGKDVASLKGRTTYKGPVKTDVLEIPKSIQKEQNVHADVFHWGNNQFILFVLGHLFVVVVYIIGIHPANCSILGVVLFLTHHHAAVCVV